MADDEWILKYWVRVGRQSGVATVQRFIGTANTQISVRLYAKPAVVAAAAMAAPAYDPQL